MTKQDAYRIVYNDILNKGNGMFTGKFDAENGNKFFMFGVATIMEYLAYNVSEKDLEDYVNIWTKNFQESLDKIDQK